MLGAEALHLMGFPRALIVELLKKNTDITDGNLHDIAGNTFPGSVFFCLIVQVIAHLQDTHFERAVVQKKAKAAAKAVAKKKSKWLYRGDDIASQMLG